MALDRLFTAYPSLTAAAARRGGVELWATRQLRTQLISTGSSGIYDVTNLLARESAVLRTRWRPDITLRTVLVADDGDTWLLSEIGEVGRRRYLDLAATIYVGVSTAEAPTAWPRTTSPYTLPARTSGAHQQYQLVDADGAGVQNLVIRRWFVDDEENLIPTGPQFDDATRTVRSGITYVHFYAANAAYRGLLYPEPPPGPSRPTLLVGTQIELRNGSRGHMRLWISESNSVRADGGWMVQPDDAEIPLPVIGQGDTLRLYAVFAGDVRSQLAIGQAIRVLSQEEIDG